MTRFEAEPFLAPLKDFQRATVEHVTDRLYRSVQPSRRFLVADESGLGKSLVARGVIARAVEHQQDNDPDGSDADGGPRLNVVYVCANAEIAGQNLKRLNVTGQDALAFTNRLTLLATQARRPDSRVNLVSFTPGTSFELGGRTGRSQERALLHLLLTAELGLTWRSEMSSRMLLQGNARDLDSFTASVQRLQDELPDGLDPVIAARFAARSRELGHLDQFTALIEELGHQPAVPPDLGDRARELIAGLRAALAQASVEALEPDLVILDEFQRFRHLLDPGSGDPAAELAHHLFGSGAARVLLLSANPYKPFTLAEESREGEDHGADFTRTLSWLAQDSPLDLEQVNADLTEYRSALISGAYARQHALRLRDQLMLVMARTERPPLGADGMLREHARPATPVQVADLTGFAALRQVAAAVKSHVTVEYWKSVPYFINFMDGYQVSDRVRDWLQTEAGRSQLAPLLARTQRLDRAVLDRYEVVDLGNGRLRALAADTVGQDWWQLLWVPPSMPYLAPGGVYAGAGAQDVTKRLVFSSWSAAPTAIASLLSYEADRLLLSGAVSSGDAAGAVAPGDAVSPGDAAGAVPPSDAGLASGSPDTRPSTTSRLGYRLRDGDQPASLSTLALFWPHPELAALADPLELARTHPDQPIAVVPAMREVIRRLVQGLPDHPTGPDAPSPWHAVLSWPGALPDDLAAQPDEVTTALSGPAPAAGQENGPNAGLAAHTDLALTLASAPAQPARSQQELLTLVALIATHAPGNIAYRALNRVLGPTPEVTPAGLWQAAAVLAAGLRCLFSRPESALLLDQLYAQGDQPQPYWQSLLCYCADGNLQAVLDEYLHHLRSADSAAVLDDAGVMALAQQASDALSLPESVYQAFDPTDPDRPLEFPGRFALRYGDSREDDSADAPLPQVRGAFNSPFWPFVLATTSVGQEGLDFQWWSHAVVHWNLPANPVDFEQREGRVNRFGGHAVRRNIAARHRAAVMTSAETDPWKAAYDAALDQASQLGEFAPYWVYPGPSQIERQILSYPLSRDTARVTALKDDLALYRLAFGQPRQEDLLEFLKRRGVGGAGAARIDLRPDPIKS